jgi:hypothetical protein
MIVTHLRIQANRYTTLDIPIAYNLGISSVVHNKIIANHFDDPQNPTIGRCSGPGLIRATPIGLRVEGGAASSLVLLGGRPTKYRVLTTGAVRHPTSVLSSTNLP